MIWSEFQEKWSKTKKGKRWNFIISKYYFYYKRSTCSYCSIPIVNTWKMKKSVNLF